LWYWLSSKVAVLFPSRGSPSWSTRTVVPVAMSNQLNLMIMLSVHRAAGGTRRSSRKCMVDIPLSSFSSRHREPHLGGHPGTERHRCKGGIPVQHQSSHSSCCQHQRRVRKPALSNIWPTVLTTRRLLGAIVHHHHHHHQINHHHQGHDT
jgi:hypothetical protein